MNIQQPARNIPVLATADIIVCGGGIAGISAAVSAARHGAEVILVERWPSVGLSDIDIGALQRILRDDSVYIEDTPNL